MAKRRSKPKTITAKWRKILCALPGYDPIATAKGCTFDERAASDAIAFVQECCRHVKGELAGQLIRLELWQKSVFANLFGWKKPDGMRRYREAFVFIPRKNSKTTIASMIVCVVAYTDHEPGAEMYSTAAEGDQARICFDITKGMIRAEPLMKERAELFKYSVVFAADAAFYRAVTAKAETKHGYNPHLVVNDELHAHKSKDLTVAMESAMGSRRQPLIVHLSTSDFERAGSICNDKHDYACKVRDGIIKDESFLPVIYEASREDDWRDEATWAKANPNLGVSVSREYLARECQKAQDSPSLENEFKRLHLNIRTEQAVRWVQMDKWDACCDVSASLAGGECWAGLDLSTTTDLSAFTMVFPQEDETVHVRTVCWAPRENAIAREKKDRVPYVQWADEGHLILTPGDVVDYGEIRKRINELGKEFNVREIAIDRWNAAQLAQDLQADGFEVVAFGQGYASMSAPAKEFEKLILSGGLRHDGDPVLRWAVSNVAIEQDAAGNIKPSKRKSTERIDPVVAAVMAVGRMMVKELPPQESVYSTRGALVW